MVMTKSHDIQLAAGDTCMINVDFRSLISLTSSRLWLSCASRVVASMLLVPAKPCGLLLVQR